MRLHWSLMLVALLTREAHGQTLLLELRPRAGDTLRMRLEQKTVITGERRGATIVRVTTTMQMFSRAIVEQTTPEAALILAVTDSVSVASSDAHARELGSQTERQLKGQWMRLRLRPDGSVALPAAASAVPKEVSDLLSVMPASFPRSSLVVGDTWMREMPIPADPRIGVPLPGVVRARFRLDSIGRAGDLAFVSLRGVLRAAAGPEPPAATRSREQTRRDAVPMNGSVNGAIIVDRRRGWLSESHFQIEMRATVAPAGAVDAMRFRTQITQHMRVVPLDRQ